MSTKRGVREGSKGREIGIVKGGPWAAMPRRPASSAEGSTITSTTPESDGLIRHRRNARPSHFAVRRPPRESSYQRAGGDNGAPRSGRTAVWVSQRFAIPRKSEILGEKWNQKKKTSCDRQRACQGPLDLDSALRLSTAPGSTTRSSSRRTSTRCVYPLER